MLAVIFFGLLAAVASGAPQSSSFRQPEQAYLESPSQVPSGAQAYLVSGSQGSATQAPAGAQVVYLQGYSGQYSAAAPTQGAQIAYIVAAPQTQQYQLTSIQPSQQLSSIQYTQPQVQVQYKTPEVHDQQVQVKFKAPEPQQQQVQVHYKAPELQQQQVQVHYKAPEVKTKIYTKPAPAAPIPAPAPGVKQYQVHENQVPHWAIVRQSLDDNFDGHFQYDFETENGISLNAVGDVRQISPKEQAQVIQGQYSYTAPDGTVITTYYTADENGFVAQGDHLPQAPQEPELPPLIAKSLAYIRSLPPQPEYQQ